MQYITFPFVGLFVGIVGATAGVGGGFMIVPFLIWMGFSKDTAVATSFLNMVFLVAASLTLYGFRGSVDWKTGLLMGVGSLMGVFLAVYFVQPNLNEKVFRYFLAIILVVAAVSLVLKK